MKIITKTVSLDIEYFVDGNFKHNAQDMLLLIEDLLECDGFFNLLCFDDKEVEEYFINKKLVHKTPKGSCSSNEKMKKKLKKLYNKIYSMLYPNEEPVF